MEEKFKAVCCVCNKECEVPFNPKNPKTVKCRSCYKQEVQDAFDGNIKTDTRDITMKIMAECIEDIESIMKEGVNHITTPEQKQAFVCSLFIQRCRLEVR
jgi:CxxC-x17-CxxC domain-containing protein